MARVDESVLRDVVEADVPIFFEHQRDPEATRMAAFPARDSEAFAANWQKILATHDTTKKAIVLEGEVAGYILCFERDGKRLVGYWIGRDFWGKGLATKALAELLTEVTVRPLYAYAATANIASTKVLEKCGFVFSSSRAEFDEALGEDIEEALYELRADSP